MEPSWRIELFGGLRAVCGDRVLTRFRTRKAAELLSYLAYHRDRVHPREALIDLLWPDGDPEVCRHRLSNALSSLRQALAAPGFPTEAVLLADRLSVRLNLAHATTDVAAFESALDSAVRAAGPSERAHWLARAVAICRGELLPGYNESWVLSERERLAERFFQSLSQLIAYCERTDDPDAAIQYAHRGLSLDPLREEIHRDLIRLYLTAGDPDAARRQYAELERLLKDALDVTPSLATQTLVRATADRRPTTALSPVHSFTRSPLHSGLPAPLTRCFGREDELGRLRSLLLAEGRRLVTLTGPGGSGKTRLALEAARQMASTWADAVWFVPLADLADARAIGHTIRDALRLPPSGNVEPIEQVIVAIARRPTLLLLDNFEHLVGAPGEAGSGALVVKTLLQRLPALTCLVTSRRRLAVEGEREFAVVPLPVPGIGCRVSDAGEDWGVRGAGGERAALIPTDTRHPTPDTLFQCPSVQLFVDRARAVDPAFEVTGENVDAVASICRRLEGIPLSIELAAARVRLLTPGQIEEQLARAVRASPLLVNRDRDAPARHRTLHAMIGWSYNLLSPGLQRFFARLSVFRAGWTPEAAEPVCSLPGWAGPEVFEALTSLSEQSLLQRWEAEAVGPRLGMLETIREYGRERLTAGGEEETIRRRHAAYFLELVEQTGYELGARRDPWLDRLEQEHDNLRAALTWSLEQDPDVALRLAGSLEWFWNFRGYWSEGRRWLEAALARSDPSARTAARARALQGAGTLAWHQRDLAANQRFQEESISIWRELGERGGLSVSLINRGWGAFFAGDLETARRFLEEGEGHARASGYTWIIAPALNGQGQVALHQDRWADSVSLCRNAVAAAQEVGDPLFLAWALGGLGRVLQAQKDYATARQVYEEHRVASEAARYPVSIAEGLRFRGLIARHDGDTQRARTLLLECLEIERTIGNKEGISAVLYELGQISLCLCESAAARAFFAESLEFCRQLGYADAAAACLEGLTAAGT